MKNMLNFKEFTADELMDILNLALDMKKNPEKYSESLKGKKLYTLFEKTSTRTFLSFATGITEYILLKSLFCPSTVQNHSWLRSTVPCHRTGQRTRNQNRS